MDWVGLREESLFYYMLLIIIIMKIERDFVIFQLSIYLNFFMLDKILDELLFLYRINHFYYFL